MITAVVAPPITRDGAREAAQRELTKSIYHRYDDPWPVRVYKAVTHWIGHVFDVAAQHSPGGGAGAAALIVAIVALLVFARWRLGPIQRRRRLAQPVLGTSVTSAADYRRTAHEAAAAGRWSEAVIAAMRATARELEEQEVLPARPGRTADELARELGTDRPALLDVVSAAATVFDAVAYGGRPGDADTFRTVLAADDAVRRRHAGAWR